MQININTEQITDDHIRKQFEQIISTLNLHNQQNHDTTAKKPTGEDTPAQCEHGLRKTVTRSASEEKSPSTSQTTTRPLTRS